MHAFFLTRCPTTLRQGTKDALRSAWGLCTRCRASSSTEAPSGRADAVLRFWLGEDYRQHEYGSIPSTKRLWYANDAGFDQEVREKFSEDMRRARESERLRAWGASPHEGLAQVILMDQLPRNAFRDTAEAFALDSKALSVARALLDSGRAGELVPMHRLWLFLPFMHSEHVGDGQECVRLHAAAAAEARERPGTEAVTEFLEQGVDFAERHLAVLKAWGRYPHRNKLLGRENTPEEEAAFRAGSIPSF